MSDFGVWLKHKGLPCPHCSEKVTKEKEMSDLPTFTKCLCLGSVPGCQMCKLEKAITIMWEALDWVEDKSKGLDEAQKHCREAMREIERLGQ